MNEAQRRILEMIADAGGDITIHRFEAMKEHGDGYQIAGLNKRGLTEWIRPEGRPGGNAVGVRITAHGRVFLAEKQTGAE